MKDRVLSQEIRKVYWEDVRLDFLRDEPELTKIIDELSPSHVYAFQEIPYRFGSIIHSQGKMRLPLEGSIDTVPFSDSIVSNELKEALGYSGLPLTCLTNQRGVEVYRELLDRVHSIAFFSKGMNLGIYEFFESATPYIVSAGARTMQILPKVMDSVSHARLKQYGVTSPPPHNPLQQHKIFAELANHASFSEHWRCNLVSFMKPWIDKIYHDSTFLPLKYFILQRAWEHTKHNRNRFVYDGLWQSLSNVLSEHKIKVSSHILEIFKNLVYIALGSRSLTAYQAANEKSTHGPIDGIMKIYIEDYGLKEYFPTMMLPDHFLTENQEPVYFSLNFANYLESSPRTRDSVSTKQDLEELIWLYERFQRELIHGNLIISHHDKNRLLNEVELTFFHSEAENNNKIILTSDMPKEDKNLLYLPEGINPDNRKFSERSTFVRGCIKVSLRKTRS